MRPRKQRQRKMSEERTLAAKAEVQRLLDAKVIREVMYPEWLANVVLVPKKNVHRFYGPQQGLCQRLLPLAKDRYLCGQSSWLSEILTTGLFLRISPNLAQKKKTKERQASQPHSARIATPECQRASKTLEQPSPE